jgi:hypothetical protein
VPTGVPDVGEERKKRPIRLSLVFKKNPAFKNYSFFSWLADRAFKHGKISPVKSTGRPKTHDDNYDHITKKAVDVKRAL